MQAYPWAQMELSSPHVALRVPRSYIHRHQLMQFAVPPGIGDYTSQVNTAATIASSGAATTASMLVAFGAVTGPVGAVIGAAAAALITVGSLIAKAFEGCGQTCIIASNDANKFGDLLLQNLRAYTAAPYNPQLQAAALNNYQTLWAALGQACGDPSLGQAGVRCITDRQAGACQWKASPGGWVADPTASGGYRWTDWGAAGSGTTCWNWDIGFRQPIANDPRAANYNPATGSTGGVNTSGPSGTVGSSGTSDNTMLIILGLVGVGLLVWAL